MNSILNINNLETGLNTNLKKIDSTYKLDNSNDEFSSVLEKIKYKDSKDFSLSNIENDNFFISNYIDVETSDLDKISKIEAYSLKPVSEILINLFKNDSQNKELLVSNFNKEFLIDRNNIENLINKYINLSKSEVVNNEKIFFNFINDLNLDSKDLNKAFDILNNVISKHIVKASILDAQKTSNTQDFLISSDFTKLNKNISNDKLIIKDKFGESNNKIEALFSDLSDLEIDTQNKETSNNTNQDFNSNIDKKIDYINNESLKAEININEKLNVKVLNDTVLSNVKILSDKDGGFINLDLKSMDLGNLSLKVETLSNNKVAINLICENSHTKKLLESNLSDLKSALSSLNIKADFNISLNENSKTADNNSKKDFLAYNDKGNEKQKDQNKKEGRN